MQLYYIHRGQGRKYHHGEREDTILEQQLRAFWSNELGINI